MSGGHLCEAEAPTEAAAEAGFFDMLSPDKTGGFFYFPKNFLKKSKKVFDFS